MYFLITESLTQPFNSKLVFGDIDVEDKKLSNLVYSDSKRKYVSDFGRHCNSILQSL